MNRTNIGILTVAAGFLLIWGGATGRLGAAWGALVHGGSTTPAPTEPAPESETSTGTTGNDAARTGFEPVGGAGRSPVHSLGINGLMSWQGSGSV